ncbi:RNA-guided endonuclease InsQ/TnpB family protein [Streptomyces sp. NPDC090075]|uniref:RNA-guided endonuclease InsQ/TnpB family protein n=1 Tax=Streptomyces sp. NPDC090075 TaxID=3365937 RepID=UPI003819F483
MMRVPITPRRAATASAEHPAAGEAFPKTGDLSKLLITEAKLAEEREWLVEVSAVVLQQSLRDLDTAYRNFFDGLKGKRPRMGAPRFKSLKANRQAVRFTGNARWKITTGVDLYLPKIGDVRVKWSRSLPSSPSTVTVIKDAAGRYFASFVVETDAPRFLRRAEKKLKREQRRLSRKVEGSKNRDKARIKVARAHAQMTDARREFHHQLSRLAKSVHDAGWSAFVTMLEYKAAKFGRSFRRIGRFEPTSQVCSQCGVKDGPKPLHVRVWECGACGAVLDRDINAAINVAKAAGLAVSACGAQVRPVLVPAQRSEAGTHRDGQPTVVGIPWL